MMKKLLLILLCLPMIGFGQGWEQTYYPDGFLYDGDCLNKYYPMDIEETSDGGYIICGWLNHFNCDDSDVFVLKISSSGAEEWSYTYNGEPGAEYTRDAGCDIEIVDGGYIIAGFTESELFPFLMKLNESGIEQWKVIYEYDYFNYWFRSYNVELTSDGGYIISFVKNDALSETTSAYFIKTDSYGVVEDEWSSDEVNYEYPILSTIAKQTSSNTYTYVFANKLVKTNASGVELWSQTYDSTEGLGFSSFQKTYDNGYVIFGEEWGEMSIYDKHLIMIKTDENGVEQWRQIYTGLGVFYQRTALANMPAEFAQQTSDGGYVLCGTTFVLDTSDIAGSSLDKQLLIIKTDEDGVEQWNELYETNLQYQYDASCVKETSDGELIFLGTKKIEYDVFDDWGGLLSSAPDAIYIIKINESGTTSTFEIPLPNPNRKLNKTIDILGKETKPQPNTPIIEIYDDGTVEKKVIIE